jgi:pyruvate/2-oxoglutarate dehydrogenase complex dihydrolipoamide dehydrogenase (E3) component
MTTSSTQVGVVAVIGAGMGGYAGAMEARKRGLRVLLFESGAVGGT